MGVVRRQSIKILIVYGLGIAVGYFNLLWLFPYCLRTEEIGLVRVIGSASTLLAVFIPMGAQKILLRFFPYYKDPWNGHFGLVPFTLGIPLLGALVMGLFLYFFNDLFVAIYQDRSPLFVEYFYYVLPIAAALAFQKVLIAYGRSQLKAVIPNFFQSVMLRLFTSVAVILYFLGITGQEGMIQGYLAGYVGVVVLLLFYSNVIDEGKGLRKVAALSLHRVKEMLRFGGYMMFTSIGGILMRTIDELMLSALIGLSSTGIYSIAFFIGVVIELPKRAVLQTLSPMLAKARKEDDQQKIADLYKRGSINNLLLGSLLFLCIWLNLDDLFRIMPKGELFRQGKYVVLFIALSKLFGITVGVSNEILMTSKWYRFNFFSMLAVIPVIILLNLILIPDHGIEGAAIASLLSGLLLNLLRMGYLWSKESIQPFTIKTLWVLLLNLTVYELMLFVPMPSSALYAILLRSLSILLLFAATSYFLRLSEDGSQLIDGIFARSGQR